MFLPRTLLQNILAEIQTTKKSRKSAPVPEKLTTYQRARAAALRLVLWVVIPLLLLSLILVTLWSHDPELEDCQGDPRAPGPVNCPMDCPRGSSAMYFGPFLGIRLGWVYGFLFWYIVGKFMYEAFSA